MTTEFANDLVHTLTAMLSANREPRIVALLPAAFLEAHLQALIVSKLPPVRTKLRDKLFGSEGALSNLGTKIDVAEALGAITQDLAARATIVARIRNRFAHRIDVRGFEHPEVAKLIDALHQLNKAAPPRIYNGQEWIIATKADLEGRFIAGSASVCFGVASAIYGGDFAIQYETEKGSGLFRSIFVQKTPPGSEGAF